MTTGEPTPGQAPADISRPVENSVESQNQALLSELRTKNQQLGGRVFSEYSIGDDHSVLVFEHTTGLDDESWGGAGVHSANGPVLIKTGVVKHAMGRLTGGKQLEANWGDLTSRFKGAALSPVDSEAKFKDWEAIMSASIFFAEQQLQDEAAKRQYVTKALEALRADDLNTRT